MNLIKKYEPLVKGQARKLAEQSGLDRDDLAQEGYMVLIEMQERDLDGEPNSISAYCKLRVVGAMRDYIARNMGPVEVPLTAFWKHGERAYTEPQEWFNLEHHRWSLMDLDNPETQLLLKEKAIGLHEKVIAFTATLTPKEIVVFYGIIWADDPATTRDMADTIGVKSPQTVVNIRNKVLNKWKEIV